VSIDSSWHYGNGFTLIASEIPQGLLRSPGLTRDQVKENFWGWVLSIATLKVLGVWRWLAARSCALLCPWDLVLAHGVNKEDTQTTYSCSRISSGLQSD
jgi:hypothetical protein